MVRRSERLAAKRLKTDHHQETTYVYVVDNNGLVDDSRISNLSNELLHHIFSFLNMDMDWVVRTSVLSKRWRYLWKSSPILKFRINSENISKSQRFVDHVLSKRDTNSKVEKLKLKSKVFLTHVCVRKWINAATIGSVDEFSIKINNNNNDSQSRALSIDDQLPDQVFTSGIKKIRLCSSHLLPRSMCSADHIKSLILEDIIFPFAKDSDDGQLILNCPVLENLIVNHCDIRHLKTLTISTPQLKNLKYCYNMDDDCKKSLCCPKLISLHWSPIWKEISLQNISALTSVTVKVRIIDWQYTDELNFIKCLLEKAEVLREMTVKFRLGSIRDPQYVRNQANFRWRVLALPRASSILSILFPNF